MICLLYVQFPINEALSRFHFVFIAHYFILIHLLARTPCTQKSDSELPNYGRNHPLPSDKPDSDEDEPIKTDLLSDQPLDFLSAVPEVPGLPPDTSTSKVPGGGLLGDEPEDVTEDEETPLPEGVVEVSHGIKETSNLLICDVHN